MNDLLLISHSFVLYFFFLRIFSQMSSFTMCGMMDACASSNLEVQFGYLIFIPLHKRTTWGINAHGLLYAPDSSGFPLPGSTGITVLF